MATYPIRIAQIGIGHNHASAKMEALKKLPGMFEIVGVAEDDVSWREERGGFSQYKDIPFFDSEAELLAVPGLEAVAVEKDGFGIVPAAQLAAEKGLHVQMDKPAGESLPAFKMLLDTCRAKHLAFQQAYVYRYNPALKFMLKAVADGWLGDIFEIHAVMSRYDGDNDRYRRWMSQFKGGAMYIFGGYLIDLVISMLGRPDKVTPFLKQTRDDGLIDNGLAVLEYKHATATVRVSIEEVGGMKHRRVIVCGTKGTVELCPIEAPGNEYYTRPLTVRLTLKEACGPYEHGTHIVDCGPLGDRYTGQLEEFYRIIRDGMDNPYLYEHEYMLHEALLQACAAV
ncbi:MAG: Gfo/Idh/MocA family oxidoreductase [Victivallales bacterium]|nr:Gfo/Idh/MocA family oxidoreductase [Victivallales bacterium]